MGARSGEKGTRRPRAHPSAQGPQLGLATFTPHGGLGLELPSSAVVGTEQGAEPRERPGLARLGPAPGGSLFLCLQLLSSNVVKDLMLLESLLDNLAARQKDACASVRRLVLRGLANIASGSPDKVSCWPTPLRPWDGQ